MDDHLHAAFTQFLSINYLFGFFFFFKAKQIGSAETIRMQNACCGSTEIFPLNPFNLLKTKTKYEK